jgi:hypothetical protein
LQENAMSIRSLAVVLVATGALCACQTPNRPYQAVATAEAAVDQADLGSAAEHAPLELRLAREKLEQAKSKLQDEDYTDARRLAEQALVDVQLAEAKAESATARASAQDLRQGIETIQEEAERGASPELRP